MFFGFRKAMKMFGNVDDAINQWCQPEKLDEIIKFVVEKLPRKIHSSTPNSGKNHLTYLKPIYEALNKDSHIALNNQKYYNYLGIDIDDPKFDINLLRHITPTLIVKNLNNNKMHISFKLKSPVYKNSHKQVKWFTSIKNRMNKFFGGDKAFTNFLTKNPFHQNFTSQFNKVSYTMEYLENFLQDMGLKEEPKPRQPEIKITKSPTKSISYVVIPLEIERIRFGNRNTSIFNLVRNFAYKLRRTGEEVEFEKIFNAVQTTNNALTCQGLDYTELRTIAQSITDFVRNRYEPRRKPRNEGVMYDKKLLNKEDRKELDKSSRQSLGAVYTAQIKREKRIKEIEKVIDRLLCYDDIEPEDITIPLILESGTDIPKSTLYRYKEDIQLIIDDRYIECKKVKEEYIEEKDYDSEDVNTESYEDIRLKEIIEVRKEFYYEQLKKKREALLQRLGDLFKTIAINRE